MERPAPSFYPALTGLRMFVASMVYVGHNQDLLVAYLPQTINPFLDELYVGVSLFFVLSGFLITRQYLLRPFQTTTDGIKFIAKRIARIFPVYWLLLLGLYQQWLFALPELLLHITLLKGFSKIYHIKGIGQTWSLTVELTFYFLAPVLFWLIYQFSVLRIYIVLVITGLALTTLGYTLYKIGLNQAGFMSDLKFMVWATFFGRVTEFLAGGLLAYFWQVNYLKISKLLGFTSQTYLGFSLVVLTICLLRYAGGENTVGVNNWSGIIIHHLLMPVSAWFILAGLLSEETIVASILRTKPAVLLGKASYIFYLIHVGWINNWLIYVVSSSVILRFVLHWLLAVVLYLIVEKPLYWKMRQWINSY